MVRSSIRQIATFSLGVASALIAVFVFHGLQATAAPGANDATFVAIAPCRLVDTRPGSVRVGPHDSFGSDTTKVLAAHGLNGDCNLPPDAVGLSLNVTAIKAARRTFLTVWPDGIRPNASSLNPEPGDPPTPNAVTTQLAADGTFRIYNFEGDVDVVVDINGYYTAASLEELAFQVDTLQQVVALVAAGRSFIEVAEQPPGSTIFAGGSTTLLDVTVVVPIDGVVRVDLEADVSTSSSSTTIGCAPVRTDLFTDVVGTVHRWSSGSGGASAITGSEVFLVQAGTTATFELRCSNSGGMDVTLLSSQLIATFTANR